MTREGRFARISLEFVRRIFQGEDTAQHYQPQSLQPSTAKVSARERPAQAGKISGSDLKAAQVLSDFGIGFIFNIAADAIKVPCRCLATPRGRC